MITAFFLTNWFLEAMKFLFANLNSVFFTILISTVLLRVLTVPSDIKTRKASADMAKVQPELQKIQKKYQSDPQRAQREQQKLMKERGVSMWGSCLPLLITMPLFFCFISAFRFWGYEMTIRLLTAGTVEEGKALFESFRFLWVNNIWQPDNGLKPVMASASTFLSTKNLGQLLYLQQNPAIGQKLIEMGLAETSTCRGLFVGETACYRFLTTDAAVAAYDAAMAPYLELYKGFNNGWFILPVIAGATNFLSAWLMQKSQPPQEGQAANTGKIMAYTMPIMSIVFCLSSNAAFAIYWTLSSMMMIIVNLLLNKKYPRIAAAAEEDKK